MKTYSLKDKLHFLVTYYEVNRNINNVKLMWEGANAAQCLIVVDSQKRYKYITQNHGPFTRPLNLNELDESRGSVAPLAWDDVAINGLLKECLGEIIELESKIKKDPPLADSKDEEIKRLKQINQHLVNVIEQTNQILGNVLGGVKNQ